MHGGTIIIKSGDKYADLKAKKTYNPSDDEKTVIDQFFKDGKKLYDTEINNYLDSRNLIFNKKKMINQKTL